MSKKNIVCRYRLVKYFVIIFFILVNGCIIYSIYNSKYTLSESFYTIDSSDINGAIRITHLTDLHNSQFGDTNKKLILKVTEERPDIILITGDILNYDDENTDIAVCLISDLSKIAPVYLSMGNHEIAHMDNYHNDLYETFTDAGARVLDLDYEDVIINGQIIRIGGLYGYALPEEPEEKDQFPEETDFLKKFQDTDDYKVLICHMPAAWIEWGSLEAWDVDIIFSGHAHGGQIRIPFIGGLYAPDQGWFVGKSEGLYFSEDNESTIVLSRGLGSSGIIPRINNKPEVVVVDLFPEE
ncbi:metallophosphoesterase [Alloiococcus sp. CFN-8]|uniref:metallophosphoesterase n=1 Tax=Alloiococcus sp. CFN-8 TaxID=3416081 RepID=UPI003CE972E0